MGVKNWIPILLTSQSRLLPQAHYCFPRTVPGCLSPGALEGTGLQRSTEGHLPEVVWEEAALSPGTKTLESLWLLGTSHNPIFSFLQTDIYAQMHVCEGARVCMPHTFQQRPRAETCPQHFHAVPSHFLFMKSFSHQGCS